MAADWYYARDGEQKGPVSIEQLKALAQSGQLPHDVLCWTAGMADWQPAAAVPGLFPGPPPLPPMAQSMGYYNGPPVAPRPPDAGMRMLLPVGRSAWAIAAGYLGLFSILGCAAPISLIVSIVAIRDLKKHPELHGMGRAIFGLVMGILGSVIFVLMIFGMALSKR